MADFVSQLSGQRGVARMCCNEGGGITLESGRVAQQRRINGVSALRSAQPRRTSLHSPRTMATITQVRSVHPKRATDPRFKMRPFESRFQFFGFFTVKRGMSAKKSLVVEQLKALDESLSLVSKRSERRNKRGKKGGVGSGEGVLERKRREKEAQEMERQRVLERNVEALMREEGERKRPKKVLRKLQSSARAHVVPDPVPKKHDEREEEVEEEEDERSVAVSVVIDVSGW